MKKYKTKPRTTTETEAIANLILNNTLYFEAALSSDVQSFTKLLKKLKQLDLPRKTDGGVSFYSERVNKSELTELIRKISYK